MYAGRGIWFCIRHERNFRIHIVASIYVLWFGFWFSLGRAEWAILLLTLAMVLTAEAVNTAVEQAVELSSPKVNPTARIAKDAAAAAVLISSVSAVVVGALLFYQPEKLVLFFTEFAKHPRRVFLLILSLAISFLFVKYGGVKKRYPE